MENRQSLIINIMLCKICAGVTEEQFKETWTRTGATGVGGEGNPVVAKARM